MDPITNPIVFKTAPLLDINELTKNDNVSKIYGNGFQTQASMGDANILIKLNEVPLVLVSMSLQNLKNLGNQINNLIELYAKNTGELIYSTDEITLRAQEHQRPK